MMMMTTRNVEWEKDVEDKIRDLYQKNDDHARGIQKLESETHEMRATLTGLSNGLITFETFVLKEIHNIKRDKARSQFWMQAGVGSSVTILILFLFFFM